jgi:hypothetical protein
MKTCGATPGGPDLTGIDLSTQSLIQGVVLRAGVADGVPNGAPVGNAYVRLLDGAGEFTAEVPTNSEGQFRFFTAPGSWTVVVLATGMREVVKVEAVRGAPVDLVIQI